MNNFFVWGGEHPFLFVYFVLVAGGVLNGVTLALRRRS
jgi:hypothetical protein